MTSYILHRYLFSEIFKNSIVVFFVLGFIILITQFSNLLQDINSNVFSSAYLLDLIFLLSVPQLTFLLPISFLLGSIFALGKFNRDSELVVFIFSGFSFRSQQIVLLSFAFLCSFIVGWVSIEKGPESLRSIGTLEAEYARQGSCCAIPEAEFLSIDEIGGVLYAEQSQNGLAQNVFIYYEPLEAPPVFSFAQEAQWIQSQSEGSLFVMSNGMRYEGFPGDLDFKVISFAEQRIFLPYEVSSESTFTEEEQSIQELLSNLSRESQAELFYRFSSIVIILVLSLYPLALTNLNPRLGKYASLFPALIIFLLYMNVVAYAQNLLITTTITSWLLIITPHIMFIFLPFLIYFMKKRLS